MNYINNLDRVQKLYSEQGKVHEMIEQMMGEVREFSDTFEDDYTKMTDWGHKYFCEDDGELLNYNRYEPTLHKCGICGKEYKSDELDRVWLYFYRNEAITSALKGAVVYKVTGDRKYLKDAMELVGYYAKNYMNFEIHARDTPIEITTTGKLGYARIMPQELNEAIIAIKIAGIVEIIKDDLELDFYLAVKEMFKEMFRILKPQANKVHNKPCWSISAIGVMGLTIDDEDMIDFAFNSEFNINRQLKEGLTESDMWYEGSMHYNFFTLEGVIALLHSCKLHGKECNYIEQKVEDMLVAAYDYAFDNKVFPNPNDGWPDLSLNTFSYVYHLAYKLLGDEKIGSMLRGIENSGIDREDPKLARPYYHKNELSLEELMFNTDFNKSGEARKSSGSINFPTSHMGILKNERVNVFVKYGHLAKSHAHADKMNIEFTLGDKLISRDISNTGYASKLCNEWHRLTAAHNTVTVDGMDHTSIAGGEVVEFTENTLVVKAENVYDESDKKVDMIRAIKLKENGFVDKFKVNSDKDASFDYFIHLESGAQLDSHLTLESSDLGYTGNGYQHITDVNKVEILEDELVINFEMDGEKFIGVIEVEGKEVFICKTLDNPVNRHRTTLIVRSKGSKASFTSRWYIK